MRTKLGPPGRAGRAVDRPRLRRLLDGGGEARLVLVSAPAGFGKTTLLADWLGGSGLAWGWLSLEAADNDPARFMRYLLAAAHGVDDDDDRVSPCSPADGEMPSTDGALADVLDVLEACRRPSVLVLDDYHLIDEPRVHEHVAELLGHLPADARLVIATRADPPLPLARLRARAELLEVRAADLRFTDLEADAWLRGRIGLALSPRDVARLATRTEGWAAALQLAAVSLHGRPDPSALVEQFGASHRFVLDFVVEEVLTGLPEDTQEFLLRTSVLDRLSGPLCDAVTGGAGGQRRLEGLDQTNLPIQALDDERHWWRYHALFAEVLRARLEAAHADLVAVLHERAAAWHEGEGEIDDAVRHALQAGTLERARRLLRSHWLERLMAGEIATVRRWLDALPAEIVRSDPQLSVAYGWSLLLAGESAGVAERIADGEQALATAEADHVDRAVAPSQLESQRAKLAEMDGDLDVSVSHARRALALIPEGIDPTYGALMRGQATIQLAHGLRRAGDPEAAALTYRAAIPLFSGGGNWLAVARSVYNVALLEIGRGGPDAALELCRATLAGRAGGPGSSALAAIHVAIAEALLALGEIDRAEAEATEADRLARRGGDRPTITEAADVLGRISQARSLAARGPKRSASTQPGLPTGLFERLTARELEFLRLVCAGRSNRQIAEELFVTVGTVKAHLHTIYGKLGAGNRVETILRAREFGLVD